MCEEEHTRADYDHFIENEIKDGCEWEDADDAIEHLDMDKELMEVCLKDLAKDLKFIETFKPEMCGIGPFIPHKETPFKDYPAGSVDLACYLLSIIRLIHPPVLLPATTALATLSNDGREKGLQSGANVIMPNLSPVKVRGKYTLYDGKVCTGEESAQCRNCITKRVEAAGYQIVTGRGDFAGDAERR